ncbi:hypothetical protein COLO4_08201 [Corchorus olitorius]|uniref:DUF4283 domain-containing protein n=1 Tax=Corchorus olitorius TaxID=93759 RepID=A0A1R3KGT4_9ROSI|nr:hypothetical protein COLO4_08201 [Corchorus olitorius]
MEGGTETETRGRSGEEDDQLQRSTKKVKAAEGPRDAHVPAALSFKDAMMGGRKSSVPRFDELGSLESDEGLIQIAQKDGWPLISLSENFKTHIRNQWKDCILVKLLGRNISYNVLTDRLQKLWNPKGDWDLVDCALCPKVTVPEMNPAEKGEGVAAAIVVDAQHPVAAHGGGQCEPTVYLPTGDFGPWMMVQPRKSRKPANQIQKSRTPFMAGRGDKEGSRFSALAEEGGNLNLEEENIPYKERDQVVEAWARGVYNTSKGSSGPGSGTNKAQKQLRRAVNPGPTSSRVNNGEHNKASGSRDIGALRAASSYLSASRVSLVEQHMEDPDARVEDISDTIEDDDLMDGNFHSAGLEAGERGLDVRLRNPPDKNFLGSGVPETQFQDTLPFSVPGNVVIP